MMQHRAILVDNKFVYCFLTFIKAVCPYRRGGSFFVSTNDQRAPSGVILGLSSIFNVLESTSCMRCRRWFHNFTSAKLYCCYSVKRRRVVSPSMWRKRWIPPKIFRRVPPPPPTPLPMPKALACERGGMGKCKLLS